MARLRAPGGCPWDREQTFDTIKPFLLEETYEVMAAIDARDWGELADELGDLLLQVVFFSQMAAEAGHFTIEEPIDAINAKLIRRHPHVFGEETADTGSQVLKRWAEIKAEEKKKKGGMTLNLGINIIEINLATRSDDAWVFDIGAMIHTCKSLQMQKRVRQFARDEVDIRVGNGAKVAALAIIRS